MERKRLLEVSCPDGEASRLVTPRVETPAPDSNTNTSAASVRPGASGASAPSAATNPLTGQPFGSTYFKCLPSRSRLPIFGQKKRLQDTVRQNPVTLLVGETGSGKTTQVPPFLAELREAFSGLVACTQPRRIAAISVASRVADEQGVRLGEEVGYHVRFQSMQSPSTRVLYLTDGMLLREAFSDADLSKYSVVVVDEAHERTIDTDVVLGLLKQLLTRRPMFRLVVMSATLDVAKIQSFFPSAPLVQVAGRMYDVEVYFSPHSVKDYVAASVECVTQIHKREPRGDVLCFLTGEAEIERAVSSTRAALARPSELQTSHQAVTDIPFEDSTEAVERPSSVVVLPLYGSLSLVEQQRVFQAYPADTRKIVFATNIAETSVTIDGIVVVVDCGYQKQSLYSTEARVDYLLPALISKASAEQRKGRAGRTQAGKCFRMYTAADYQLFPDQTYPEILRSNIANNVLLLLKLGIHNPCHFPFIDPPSEEGFADAFYQLLFSGAVDDSLQLTDFGRRMAAFPVEACLARMLLKASEYGCAGDAVVVAAMLEAGNAFARPPTRALDADKARMQFEHPDGDHLTLFFVFHGFYRNHQSAQYCWDNFLRYQTMQQAVQVYHQLRRLMTQLGIPITSTYKAEANTVDSTALRKSILEGFFTQVAYLSPATDTYCTVRDNMKVALHRHSVLQAKSRQKPRWVMYDRLEVQGAEGTFMRTCTAVEVGWLLGVSEFFSNPVEIANGEIAIALRRAAEANKMDEGNSKIA